MNVGFPSYSATDSEMAKLIAEVKKISSSNGVVNNELHTQINSQCFSDKFGKESNSESLKVHVERYNTTFNVYWRQIEEAAEYSVEVYKYVSRRWYKLTEIYTDRNQGYVAIKDLVGNGYVFRVIARNRIGEELAKSAGIIIGSISAQ